VIDLIVSVGVELLVGRWDDIVVADEGERWCCPRRCRRWRLATRDHVAGVVAANRCVRLFAEPPGDKIAGGGFVVVARDLNERPGERNDCLTAHTESGAAAGKVPLPARSKKTR